MEDEQAGVGGIGKGRTTSVDTDRDTADQVTCADGDTAPEESISRIVAASRQDLIIVDQVELGREHDRHDHTVDSDDLTEDNRNQVLRSNPGRLDASADDRGACQEDTPEAPTVSDRTDMTMQECPYHAAPTTDKPIHIAIPMVAQA